MTPLKVMLNKFTNLDAFLLHSTQWVMSYLTWFQVCLAMRRDKRYATRSVQPAQSGPSAKVSCTPPQARSLPVRPERGNRLPLPKTSQHGVNDESPDTDHSDDLLKPGRSRVRKNTSGNVDRPRQSIRLRKFDNVKVSYIYFCYLMKNYVGLWKSFLQIS